MEDRELIELAAKAFGLPESGWMGPSFMFVKENTFADWNPLVNDGDALRLAVKLGLTINQYEEGLFVSRYECEGVIAEKWGEYPIEDACRAIVRAAAEIGKVMQ